MGLLDLPRAVRSGDKCHMLADVCTCHLVWHVFGHCSLVPRLSAVCHGQSQPSASSSHTANPHAREEIHPCARGHCGPSANISRGVLLPLHYSGQVHQMSGGGTQQVHHSPSVCGHVHCHVGGQIGGTSHHYIWPGKTVHFSSVDWSTQVARSAAYQHHSLPPPE